MRPVSEAENMRADVRRKVDYRNPRVVAILRFGRIAAFEPSNSPGFALTSPTLTILPS